MNDGRQVLKYEFAPGYATTRGTVALLTDAAEAWHTHPRIIARARSLVAHLPSMDMDAEIRAIWEFIISHVRYVRDPLGAEYITAPASNPYDGSGYGLDELVDHGVAQEDCESIALYAASLLAAIGIPSEFEIQGRNPLDTLPAMRAARGGRFSHCSLRVKNPRTRKWVSFDPIGYWESQQGTIAPGFDLGDTLHTPGEPIEHYALSGERSLDGLLGELLGDGASNLATVEQYGDPAANMLQYAGPYGALLAAGYKAGTAIAGSQVGTPSSPTPQPAKRSSGGPMRYTGARPTSAILRSPELLEAAREATAGGRSSSIPQWVKPAAIVAGALVGAKLIGVF